MNNRGFTLIEVLITLFILAIGVLGVVALQTSTFRQLQVSHNAGIASMLASEIADRMMANSTQALAGAYDHTASDGEPPSCDTATCTDAQLAIYDVSIWQTRITGNIASGTRTPGSLPSGSGSVAQIGTTNEFSVTVRWDDDLSGSTGTDCPPLDDTDMECLQLTVRF